MSWSKFLFSSFLLVALSAIGLTSHAAVLVAGNTDAERGQSIVLPIDLVTEGDNIVALQFDLVFDANNISLDRVDPGVAAIGANKWVYFAQTGTGRAIVLVVGFNLDQIGDGAVALLKLSVSPSAASGTHSLSITNQLGVSPESRAVPMRVEHGFVHVIAPPMEAFEFRDVVANLPANQDFVSATEALEGTRQWRVNVTNGTGTPVDQAAISVHSDYSANLFPNLASFPATVGPQHLAPGATLQLPGLEPSMVPVQFSPGFSILRSADPALVPPGQSTQSVTVTVTPQGPEFDADYAHIRVSMPGPLAITGNPDTSDGEELQVEVLPDGGAFWMIHRVGLNKPYSFSAEVQTDSCASVPLPLRSAVQVEMTGHRENDVDNPNTRFGQGNLFLVDEPSLDDPANPAIAGQLKFSADRDLDWRFRVQEDFVVNLAGTGTYDGSRLDVAIDVKPFSFPNSIRVKKTGNIAVAIFSTLEFDATRVNPETVELLAVGPGAETSIAGVAVKRNGTLMSGVEDVNGDGLPDLVVHFDKADLSLQPGHVKAVLRGENECGWRFRGEDSLRILGK